MDSKIYVSAIKITEPIPKDNYLSGLPVVGNLNNFQELLRLMEIETSLVK